MAEEELLDVGAKSEEFSSRRHRRKFMITDILAGSSSSSSSSSSRPSPSTPSSLFPLMGVPNPLQPPSAAANLPLELRLCPLPPPPPPFLLGNLHQYPAAGLLDQSPFMAISATGEVGAAAASSSVDDEDDDMGGHGGGEEGEKDGSNGDRDDDQGQNSLIDYLIFNMKRESVNTDSVGGDKGAFQKKQRKARTAFTGKLRKSLHSHN